MSLKNQAIMSEENSIVSRLLKNIGNMHELGRQRAFELGNPFYAQFAEDNGLLA